MRLRRGFTLIELLIVIGIIGTLSAIVLTAVSPRRQLRNAEDARRSAAVKEIQSALYQYLIDNSALPAGIGDGPANLKPICRQGVSAGSSNCVSLDALVPTYMIGLPVDAVETNAHITGYTVYAKVGKPTVDSSWKGSDVSSFGLVSQWKFDETAGAGAADSVGENPGTVVSGGGWVAGKVANALNFSFPNTYVTHATTGIAATSGTIAMWVKPNFNGNAGGVYGFWQTRNDASANAPKWISPFYYHGTIYFRIMSDAAAFNDLTTSGAPVFTSGTWVHLAFTWDASAMRIYKNGAQIATRGSLTLPTSLDPIARIGFGHLGAFNGAMDDVRIYNRALAASEVAALAGQ